MYLFYASGNILSRVSIINDSRDIVCLICSSKLMPVLHIPIGNTTSVCKVDYEVSSFTRAKGTEKIQKIMKPSNKDWFFRENDFWPTWENEFIAEEMKIKFFFHSSLLPVFFFLFFRILKLNFTRLNPHPE